MKINIYSRNIIINLLPGLVSIILSFFSIPIYLNYLGLEQYGSFLILHMFLSITMITNLNLGKIASIKMQKISSKYNKSLISTTVFFSFLTSVILSLIFFVLYSLFVKFLHFSLIESEKLFFFALFISNIYVTLENLCKGKKLYFLSSLANLIFYSFSISIPAVFLTIKFGSVTNIESLFMISLYCKFFGVLILFLYFIYKKFFNLDFFYKSILQDFLLHAKWQTISSLYVQIFDFFDKYIIKIILGSASLALYSIPQQITGKLSILSDGLISVFIPRISSSKKNRDIFNIFNSNIYGFFYFIGLFLILLLPFFNNLLNWWLGNDVNQNFIYLFKIFVMISFYICITHIISTFLDTQLKSKKNYEIETFILILFIFGLIISAYKKEIDYFAYTLLFRALIGFILKAIFVKKYIINFNFLIIQNIIFCLIFYFSITENNYLFYSFSIIFLFLIIINFPVKIIKTEFLK